MNRALRAEPERTEAPMQIVYLLGAWGTDAGTIFTGLLKAEAELGRQKVAIGRPRRLRQALDGAIKAMKAGTPPGSAETDLLRILPPAAEAERLVLFNGVLAGTATSASRGKLIYPFISARGQELRNAVAGQDTAFFLAIRNPATFLPSLAGSPDSDAAASALDGLEPEAMRWSGMIRRLRRSVPDAPVTVWCHEDTPLLWSELVAQLTGVETPPIDAMLIDYLRTLITEDGIASLGAMWENNPPKRRADARQQIAAALADHARPEVVEMDLTHTGWSQNRIDAITAAYHADLPAIAAMDGVTLLSPWPAG